MFLLKIFILFELQAIVINNNMTLPAYTKQLLTDST